MITKITALVVSQSGIPCEALLSEKNTLLGVSNVIDVVMFQVLFHIFQKLTVLHVHININIYFQWRLTFPKILKCILTELNKCIQCIVWSDIRCSSILHQNNQVCEGCSQKRGDQTTIHLGKYRNTIKCNTIQVVMVVGCQTGYLWC